MMPLIVFHMLFSAVSDFDIGIDNYEKGNHRIAQIFLETFVAEQPYDPRIPDATYYLVKIYDRTGELTSFLPAANRFLGFQRFDPRRDEIFELLLDRLVERKAYMLALEYIGKFDYLNPDSILLTNICLELARCGYAAEMLLSICPHNDSLKILYAAQVTNPAQRAKIYKEMKDTKGRIYLTEHYLQTGDTTGAAGQYPGIPSENIDDDLLYRLMKTALVINHDDFLKLALKLEKLPRFQNKVRLLRVLAGDRLHDELTPGDPEELLLLMEIYRTGIQDTISKAPPEGLDIDSLLADTTDLIDRLRELQTIYAGNYFIDSLYCELLLRKNRISEAYFTAEKYIRYPASQKFVRKIRAFKYYRERNYKAAINDIILSGGNEAYLKYLHAECLRNLGERPTQLYQEVMKATKDSALHFYALKGYIEMEYDDKHFANIADYPLELLAGDSLLMKKCLLSNARIGRLARAESLYLYLFNVFDNDFLDARGEFLIENKFYLKADTFYDSLEGIDERQLTDKQHYNWALVPFLLGDYGRSEKRFASFIKNHKHSALYHSALFKMATIKYMNDDFEAAGDYYGYASSDSSLRLDALENQVIAYKKAENWKGVTQAGHKILAVCPEAKKPEVYFEIGYAFLRSGNAKEGINNLQKSLLDRSNQEYHYWLAEAYLGTGDFLRALYQYQKIMKNFAIDEMWYPTAWFKSGLTIELLGDAEEAKKVYKDIIKKRGPDDVWGSEAKKRLDNLQ